MKPNGSGRNRSDKESEQGIREHIIDCATGILGRAGYGALTVAAVCKLAGVTPPTLYWHFGNKEGLLAALLKHALRRDADMFLSIDVSGLSLHQTTELYVEVLRNLVISDRPNNWVILSSLSEARHAAPEIVDIIAEARRRQVDYNARVLRELWDLRNCTLLVHQWIAHCNYISLLYHDTRSEALAEQAIETYRRTFYLLIAALNEKPAEQADFRAELKGVGYDPVTLPETGSPPVPSATQDPI